VNINPTGCTTQQGMNRLAQSSQQLFQQLATGSGTVFRFKLTNTLAAGGAATANILKWNGSTFQVQSAGTVHDEEPGGYGRALSMMKDGVPDAMARTGHYSIIIMEKTIHTDITTTVNASAPTFRLARLSSGNQTLGATGTIAWGAFIEDGSGTFTMTGGLSTLNIPNTGWYRASLSFASLIGTGAAFGHPTYAEGPSQLQISLTTVSGSADSFPGTFSSLFAFEHKTLCQSAIFRVTTAPATFNVQYQLDNTFFTGWQFTGGLWSTEYIKGL
jgi:hypothetical protein